MQLAGMILGCLLLGQGSDLALPMPSGRELRSPANLDRIVAAEPGNETPAAGRPGADSAEAAGNGGRRDQAAGRQRADGPATDLAQRPLVHRRSPPAGRDDARLLASGAGGGQYHFCLDHAQELGRVKPAAGEPASLRLARASATAMLSQAELEAVRAQCELARLVRLPANAPLPLPADRPHVGPYRTNFQELFAGRTPPEPAPLTERILPIRRKAIDDQAAAVQAAEDAVVAAADELGSGRTDATAWIAASEELLRQQRAFIQSVCDYNRNIAEYGLAVVGPAMSPQALAAILIGPVQQAVVPATSVPADPRAVQPAGATEPIANRPRQPSQSQPTLAPSRDGWQKSEPTFAAPPAATPPGGSPPKNEPTLAPPREGLQRAGKNEPTLAPPREQADAARRAPGQ